MKPIVLVAVAALAASGTLALAHKGASGVMKERMDMMSVLGNNTKALAMMARGRTALDWQIVEQAGQAAVHTGQTFPEKFPADSFKAPSEAKRNIVSELENFTLLAVGLAEAGQALQNAADMQDEGAFLVAFQGYAQTCKACHSLYRE